MNDSEQVLPKEGDENAPGKTEKLLEMFAAAPFLFVSLFLFFLALAIPIKILSPKTKIFR